MSERIKLGEEIKHCEGSSPSGEEKEEIYFPTVYIRTKDLPRVKVGQKVILEGTISSTTESEDDEKTHRSCEVEVTEMVLKKEKEKNPRTTEDMDDISKGLDEIEDDKD